MYFESDLFRLFIVTVVKGEEREREIVASEQSSDCWEVLGAALMGLTVFGKKVGGRGLLLCVGAATCFVWCVICAVCVHVDCLCECLGGRVCWHLLLYISHSCLFSLQLCGLQRRMMCEETQLF